MGILIEVGIAGLSKHVEKITPILIKNLNVFVCGVRMAFARNLITDHSLMNFDEIYLSYVTI